MTRTTARGRSSHIQFSSKKDDTMDKTAPTHRVLNAVWLFAALTLGCAAYAANPIADEKIAVAQASIARAEQAGAPQAAPVELASARDKLLRAQKANADHDRKPAVDLAEQADIDARVAEATAQEQVAQKAVAEFNASMQALRQESMRTPVSAQ
jgi:malic enzyme